MNLPSEFEKKMQNLLGEDYENYLRGFAEKYGQTFRVNQLKKQPAEFLRRFAVKRVPWCETGFYYEGEKRLSLHPYYYGGAYYIQEPCAMAPASFLPVKPGDKVLDLCAAPGGKTTALAAKLRGEGLLIANDISISRCKALLKNVEMAGVKNAMITCETPEKLRKRFAGFFDHVLLDAPCSGEGMFRKEPSMMVQWSEKEVERYSQLQKEIIQEAAQMVKPGGYLLYSTCTYSPEENEQVVETLLCQESGFSLIELPMNPGVDEGHPEWSVSKNPILTKCRRFWNHRLKGEGQFVALLQKRQEIEKQQNLKPKKKSKKIRVGTRENTARDQEEMWKFLKKCQLEIEKENLQWLDERVFLLPKGLPDLTGIRVVRSGLYLGDCKKKRFEPSQALAMALWPEQYSNKLVLSLEDERVEKYLRCETIVMREEEVADEGWILICVDSLPLGWGKCKQKTIKNKFAPGWRRQ